MRARFEISTLCMYIGLPNAQQKRLTTTINHINDQENHIYDQENHINDQENQAAQSIVGLRNQVDVRKSIKTRREGH